jgi:hypothetical protein
MSDNTRSPAEAGDERIDIFTNEIFAPSGGARRDRTDDLLLAKQALSQLSYGPAPVTKDRACWLAGQPKLRSSKDWWAWEDLNFRPHAYQARALTN